MKKKVFLLTLITCGVICPSLNDQSIACEKNIISIVVKKNVAERDNKEETIPLDILFYHISY
jgi:hypothetical protein